MSELEQGTGRAQKLADRLDNTMEGAFALAERLLILGVAVGLIIIASMALWDTIVLVRAELIRHDLTRAITVGIDTVFLTVILLELLQPVIARESLARQAVDFIIIGITSGIRHGLGLVATSSGGGETVTRIVHGQKFSISVPGSGNPRDTVINVAINSGGVLLLVLALWLVRHRVETAAEQDGRPS
ncbi:MAG: hypothetical protein PVSMB7_09950 [Chloroflexota bacterium]